MGYFVEFISNFLYVSCYITIGQYLMGFKRRYKKYEKIVLLVAVLITTISWFYLGIGERIIIHALSIFIVMSIYFNERKLMLIIFYLGVFPMLSMLSTMFEMAVVESVLYINLAINEDVGKIISQFILYIYVAVIGRYFKKKHGRGLKDIGNMYLVIFAIVLFFNALIIVLLGDFVKTDLQTTRKGLFIVLYVGIVLGILIQLALLINTLLTRNIYKENEKLAKQFLERQKEHYLYLEKREHETKKFRHDIRSHLLILNNYFEKEDYNNARMYLDTLNDKVDTLGNKISVNNGIADAILNKFYEEAKEKEIELKVTGHFPMECFISAYDICTVLSNLLSNAIQAESQCEGNCVTLDIRYRDMDVIYMIIENDYNHELKGINGTFETSKPDAINHGFGLKNVEECIKANQGHMTIKTENNRFKVMLSMRNEPKESK